MLGVAEVLTLVQEVQAVWRALERPLQMPS